MEKTIQYEVRLFLEQTKIEIFNLHKEEIKKQT